MDENDRILSFQNEMLEALRKINEKKLAEEKAKMDDFNESVDKGLKFIKRYLRSKNLSNAEFNS
jgi:Na+/phosphate symporter